MTSLYIYMSPDATATRLSKAIAYHISARVPLGRRTNLSNGLHASAKVSRG